MNGQPAGRQGVLVDFEPAEAPGAELQRLQAELQDTFREAVLNLHVLRAEKSAFGPDYGLKLSHVVSNLGG